MSEDAAHDAALQRLIASRARLSQLLLPPAPEAAGSSAPVSGWAAPRRWRAQWRLWKRRGPLAPVFSAAEHGLAVWWQRNPWRETATVVGEIGASQVRPLIRRHPLAAIGIGAAAGAALAAARPWRWRVLQVHATRSTRQVFGWVAAQLSQPAVQLLMAGLLLNKSPAARPPSAHPASGPQP